MGLPDKVLAAAAKALERIYIVLGGNPSTLSAASGKRLPGDFLHEPTGTLIEIDELQYFTSARLASLDLYPSDIPLGFDLSHYKALCQRFCDKADSYSRTKTARGFEIGGRQHQRAYYDALRDLATPAMGHPPLIRIDTPPQSGPNRR